MNFKKRNKLSCEFKKNCNINKFKETLLPKHRGSRVRRARASPLISQSRLV